MYHLLHLFTCILECQQTDDEFQKQFTHVVRGFSFIILISSLVVDSITFLYSILLHIFMYLYASHLEVYVFISAQIYYARDLLVAVMQPYRNIKLGSLSLKFIN